MQLGYVPVDDKAFSVIPLTKISSPTSVKITPDGSHLLVTSLQGGVFVVDHQSDPPKQKTKLLTQVNTRLGYPQDRSGLTNLVFSSNYKENGKVFLLYTLKDQNQKKQLRVSSLTLKNYFGRLSASTPRVIWESNFVSDANPIIADGIGVNLNNEPHLLFATSDPSLPSLAQDPGSDAGKIILIKEDGSDPILEDRPYPNNPRVEVVGVGSPTTIALDQENNGFILTDTSSLIDRLIFIPFNSKSPLNLNWSGDDTLLKDPIINPNDETKDLILYRSLDPKNISGLSFHKGRGIALPENNTRLLLVNASGQKGSTDNGGKEIWLGAINHDTPILSFTPIIKRNPFVEGTKGNPVGLTVDPLTGDFYFADFYENQIYQVIPLGSKLTQ